MWVYLLAIVLFPVALAILSHTLDIYGLPGVTRDTEPARSEDDLAA